MLSILEICLGIILIIFKSQLTNFTLKQRERVFSMKFSDEQRIQAEVLSILGGLYLIISGIISLVRCF